MRARLALLASGAGCEIREVKLAHKPADMLAASPKGTVPVLVLPEGHVVDESLDIMRWALGRNDPEDWLQREDSDLIAINDGPFKAHLDRYKYPDRHASDPAEHRAAGLALLRDLETRLVSHANLCADERGLTDMAIMPFVRQFAATDHEWFDAQAIPRLQVWLERHVQSELFTAAMIRLKPWQEGDQPTQFAAA
jgi:glutathione S-transferase